MSKAKVHFELHIIPRGGHDMCVCTEEIDWSDERISIWVEWCKKG